MKCPICETFLPLHADRCPECGYRRRIDAASRPQSAAAVPAGPAVPYTPPNKTKRSRGCCCAGILVIPFLIFLTVMLFAAVKHISAEFSVDFFGDEFVAEPPFGELTPESLPAPADEGCFATVDHTLMFIRDNWDGSPILRVPETIGNETITAIGAGCFAGCEELTTILLPDTVTIISPMAFSGCTNLRGLYLHDGVELIGTDAFAGCRNLEAISIPASVTTISPGCFDDCASLRYIFYGGTYEDWNTLYSDYINPFTTVLCLDGNYYHGVTE